MSVVPLLPRISVKKLMFNPVKCVLLLFLIIDRLIMLYTDMFFLCTLTDMFLKCYRYH